MNCLTVEERNVVDEALTIIDAVFERNNQQTVIGASDAIRMASLKLTSKTSEVFAALLLNNKNTIIKYIEFFYGTINSCSVYPREVVKACIEYNAANIILMHNHPSGEVFPSSSDDQLTKDMVEILKHIDVHVHDHIIVAGTDTYSYAQHNRLPISVKL